MLLNTKHMRTTCAMTNSDLLWDPWIAGYVKNHNIFKSVLYTVYAFIYLFRLQSFCARSNDDLR